MGAEDVDERSIAALEVFEQELSAFAADLRMLTTDGIITDQGDMGRESLATDDRRVRPARDGGRAQQEPGDLSGAVAGPAPGGLRVAPDVPARGVRERADGGCVRRVEREVARDPAADAERAVDQRLPFFCVT